MATKIEWCDETWNPIKMRCTKISEGCQNCYADRLLKRGLPGFKKYPQNGLPVLDDKVLDKVYHWRKPKKVFVCSMGDLFHEDVSFQRIARVFGAMHSANQHTYMILTKRPDNMLEFIKWFKAEWLGPFGAAWPREYPHVWLGVTAENQRTADDRIPILLSIPSEVHFVSVEPMLGPIDFIPGINKCQVCGGVNWHWDHGSWCNDCGEQYTPVDWIICGPETGQNKRPFDPQWAWYLYYKCRNYNIPFFAKSDLMVKAGMPRCFPVPC